MLVCIGRRYVLNQSYLIIKAAVPFIFFDRFMYTLCIVSVTYPKSVLFCYSSNVQKRIFVTNLNVYNLIHWDDLTTQSCIFSRDSHNFFALSSTSNYFINYLTCYGNCVHCTVIPSRHSSIVWLDIVLYNSTQNKGKTLILLLVVLLRVTEFDLNIPSPSAKLLNNIVIVSYLYNVFYFHSHKTVCTFLVRTV